MRSQKATLDQLEQTLRALSSSTIVVHCNQRYNEINTKRTDLDAKGEAKHEFHIRDNIRHWDAYWSHQLEQFQWYKLGYIPRPIFKYWLICRRRDWTIAEIVKKVLDEERKKTNAPKELKEMDKEQEQADTEQRLYRNGWFRACKYLPDKDFVDLINSVMQDSDDRHIEAMLDFKRD